MRKSLVFFLTLFTGILFAKESLSDGKIQARLNILNGYATECVMHKFYTNTGWEKIEGEVGRNGIDGLYFKKKHDVIREVLVAESKWNKARLGRSGKNKIIKQMSQEWVLRTMNRLEKYKPLPEYEHIKKLIAYDQYRARLFKMAPIGKDEIQIKIYKIKNKGSKNYETFLESTLKPITLGKAKNSFENMVVEAYSSCRKEALNKYFPMLSEEVVEILLLDNYLQKKDIKLYL